MKLKMEDLLGLAGAINALVASNEPKPTQFGMKIAYNSKILQPILKSYEETREGLVKRYCVKDDKGEPVILNKGKPDESYDFRPEDRKAYADAIKEAQEVEISIDLQTIHEEKLPDKMTTGIMIGLYPIIIAATEK